MASKQRMTAQDKGRVMEMFQEDFELIQTTMMRQLFVRYNETKQAVLEETGTADDEAKIKSLEREIARLKVELQQVRERMQHDIFLRERELETVRESHLRDLGGPPSADQLLSLGFNEDSPVRDRKWHGFPLKTKFDAMVALRMQSEMDVAAPAAALAKIAKSVQRELNFSASYQDAEAVYQKFYSLNFQQYGVEITPRLADLTRLSGDKLLTVGVEERTDHLIEGKRG